MQKNKYRLFDVDNNIFEYIDFDNLSDLITMLDSFRSYFSNSYFVDGSNIMQFTGLLDDNKKEIYEEDICRVLAGECYNGIYEFDKIGIIKRQGININFVVDDVGYGLGYAMEHSSILIIGNTKIKNKITC